MLSIFSCKTAEDNCNIQYVHAQALFNTAVHQARTACAMTPGLGPIWNTSVSTGTRLESFRKFL